MPVDESPLWKPLVLVVDDSVTHLAVLRQSLNRAGYRVCVASTGREAMQMANEMTPDLLVMDVVMPDMNGFQATRKLSRAKQTAHIPIILASSKGQESDRIWGLRQGAVDYMVKPFAERELLGKIHHALTRANQIAGASVSLRS